MPEMDGFGATKIIRSIEPPGRHMPIIAMTASALPDDRARCLAVGMDDYLTKPLNRSELGSILEHWLPQAVELLETEPTAINYDAIQNLRRIGGSNEGFLSELIEVFQHESLERLAYLKEAVSRNDVIALRRVAHTHRGACINFGAQKMAQLCEQLITVEITPPDAVLELIDELERQFVKVSRLLEVERLPVTESV
jgi:CheY-like chemotaxis protein